MSKPADLDPTGKLLPQPDRKLEKKPDKKPDGTVPVEPNPYMGGGSTPG